MIQPTVQEIPVMYEPFIEDMISELLTFIQNMSIPYYIHLICDVFYTIGTYYPKAFQRHFSSLIRFLIQWACHKDAEERDLRALEKLFSFNEKQVDESCVLEWIQALKRVNYQKNQFYVYCILLFTFREYDLNEYFTALEEWISFQKQLKPWIVTLGLDYIYSIELCETRILLNHQKEDYFRLLSHSML